jgi:glycerophosphoryl diester phosphodiesterase
VDELHKNIYDNVLRLHKSGDLSGKPVDNAPRILAHRGASGYAFENSLAAFREARRLGATGVELDIHASADGALIVHHDPEIDGAGAIAALRMEEVRAVRLPNGEQIPTLPEALETCRGLEVWIELKSLPPRLDDTLLEAVAGEDPMQVGVHAFDHRIIARLGKRRPQLRRGILSASYPVDPVAPMLSAGATTLWQEWHLIDAELVQAVHRTGGEVVAWTVPDAAVAATLARLGVDALCGNYPDRLRIR